MRTAGSGTSIVGYNVQTAVDTRHHLIVAHEVTNVGNDRSRLANMAQQAKEAIQCDDLTVLADRGYFNGKEAGKAIRRYWTSVCPGCPLKEQCTTEKQRRVSRLEHEEGMEDRVEEVWNCLRVWAGTVEHLFGIIKSWIGGPTHFQMRKLKHVSTEMSLYVLAYNLKRMLQMGGAVPLMEAMRA
ncbi:MAG: hypothetical protein ACJASY_004380 [Halioglobus sp.]|jgi:hypothetical protein